MKFKKPKFWDYKKPSILSYLFLPISLLLKIFKSLKNIAKAGAWAAATAGILFIYALSKSDGIP